jgi:hypothetical protein
MKILTIVLLALLPVIGEWSNTLSIATYGAVGNGTTDDTNAINACLAAAHAASKNVFFPPGTYLCNKEDGSANILVYDAGGQNNITIYGNLVNGVPTATILTTKDTATTQLYVSAFSTNTNLTISGLSFSNTHGKITFITDAIFLQGTSGQEINNALITKCAFNGYSQAIAGQGVAGWSIIGNTFGAPQGHDNGLQNNNPCVDLWFFDNSNGYCSNIDIEQNIASGFTGTLPMSCKRPLDGFIYGTGYGFVIMGNQTNYFSEEHILIQPFVTNHDTTAKTLIQGNIIDCSLPPGSIDDNGTPHKKNYGIRPDIPNSTVVSNVVKNYTQGVLVYAPSYPTLFLKNYEVAYNKLFAASSADTAYSVQNGILIQGYTNPITGANIHDNQANGTDTAYILLSSTTSPKNVNNKYSPAN